MWKWVLVSVVIALTFTDLVTQLELGHSGKSSREELIHPIYTAEWTISFSLFWGLFLDVSAFSFLGIITNYQVTWFCVCVLCVCAHVRTCVCLCFSLCVCLYSSWAIPSQERPGGGGLGLLGSPLLPWQRRSFSDSDSDPFLVPNFPGTINRFYFSLSNILGNFSSYTWMIFSDRQTFVVYMNHCT